MARRFALVLVVTGLLAGCAGGDDEFTVPDGSGADVTQANVANPFTLNVRVTLETPNGAPVSGAAIVLYDKAYNDPFSILFNAPTRDVAAAMRTDADGRAVAKLAPGQTLFAAAGGTPGLTDERVAGVVIGAAGGSGDITIVLYHARLPILVEGVIPQDFGVTATTNPTGTSGIEAPIRFSDDPSVNAAYGHRLNSLTLSLFWNNTPTAYADLFAGAIVGGASYEGQDARQTPLASNNVETVTVPDAQGAMGVGAAALILTRSPQAAFGGVPYAFAGEATFVTPGVNVA